MHRERETETDRQTDRQTERRTDRDKETETEGEIIYTEGEEWCTHTHSFVNPDYWQAKFPEANNINMQVFRHANWIVVLKHNFLFLVQ